MLLFAQGPGRQVPGSRKGLLRLNEVSDEGFWCPTKHEFGVRDVHIAVSQAIQLYQSHTRTS